MCGAGGLATAYLVDGGRKHPGQRRFWAERFLICADCYGAGFDPETGFQWPAGRKRDRVYWQDVVGRGEQLPPTPCVACGLSVIRNADPLLQRVTCSASCATSLTRIRNGNRGTSQPCGSCGAAIATGRSDARFCSSACRQKAYRQRKSHA